MNEFDYLAKAKNKMDDEKYNEVISLCDKALKINDDLSDAYNIRGNANCYLKNYEDAIDDLSKAITINPNNADYYYDKSWVNKALKKYEEAIVDISIALELEPDCSLYYYDKGRYEYWFERYKDAIFDFTKGIELKPTENKYYLRACCYEELEEYELAFNDYNSAIEINPDCYWIYYDRGCLNKKLGKYKEAINDFEKAIKIYGDNDEAHTQIGFCKVELGKKDAMKYFNKAIKINPSSENYLNRVKARESIYKRKDFIEKLNSGKKIEECDYIYNEKQAQDDIKDLNKALDIDPEDTDCLRLRILRYTYLKQSENALFDCETLIELEPDNKDCLWAYAHTLFETKNFKKAIESFDNYLKMNDNIGDDFLYFTRGKANYELGDFKEAIKDFSKGLLFKETSELYYHRALVNYKLKHFILSYEDFKKALELDSEIETETDYKIPKLLKIFLNIKKTNESNK